MEQIRWTNEDAEYRRGDIFERLIKQAQFCNQQKRVEISWARANQKIACAAAIS